jgi:DNA-binding NarL/FixJ family response regulator
MYRILLIEDHPPSRGVLYDTSSASFPFIDIVQAADTGSALPAVDERPPDLPP